MGSLVGGLLQSVTFVVGIKALLLLVAGLYLAAIVTRPRRAAKPEAEVVAARVEVATAARPEVAEGVAAQ
jgi:hypothetical protein